MVSSIAVRIASYVPVARAGSGVDATFALLETGGWGFGCVPFIALALPLHVLVVCRCGSIPVLECICATIALSSEGVAGGCLFEAYILCGVCGGLFGCCHLEDCMILS